MAHISQFIRRLDGWFESCLSFLLAQLKHGALTPGSYVIKFLDRNLYGQKLLLFCISLGGGRIGGDTNLQVENMQFVTKL